MADTGSDGIMIGREAIKSPWIFYLTDIFMKGQRETVMINIREIFINTLAHLQEFLPERLHKSRSHRFAIYFSKNVRYGHELFKKIRHESSIHLMQELVDDYFRRNPEESIREYRIGRDHQSGTAVPISPLSTGTGEAITIR
jgi:tRNA-dihydrouridine synthase